MKTWQNVASTINNWNAQARKENFKCYDIKTRPAKDRQVLYSYKKLYSRYIDWNFSLNSKKNLLHSCDIVAKCRVENQQLKSSSVKENFKLSDIKSKIYKKPVRASQL